MTQLHFKPYFAASSSPSPHHPLFFCFSALCVLNVCVCVVVCVCDVINFMRVSYMSKAELKSFIIYICQHVRTARGYLYCINMFFQLSAHA